MTSGVLTTHFMAIEETPTANKIFVAYDLGGWSKACPAMWWDVSSSNTEMNQSKRPNQQREGEESGGDSNAAPGSEGWDVDILAE